MDKDFKNFTYTSSFLCSGIELTVGISARSTLTETIITFRVYQVFFINFSQIPSSAFDIFTSFKYYGFITEFNSFQRCKQTRRT